ncbi:MerR family transcriptional regulator [Streptomyces sp. NPDC058486]
MKSSERATDGPTLKIGELAARFGLATHVLRHWESTGLLTPVRDAHGRRRYGPEHATRIAAIQRAKQAGLSLEAIRALLSAGDPGERRSRLEAHRDELRNRLAQTQACLDMVMCALDCTHEDLATCPRFRALTDSATPSAIR